MSPRKPRNSFRLGLTSITVPVSIISVYKPTKRKCPYCGTGFYPVVPNQRFCRSSHRVSAFQRRAKGLPERRTGTRPKEGQR